MFLSLDIIKSAPVWRPYLLDSVKHLVLIIKWKYSLHYKTDS